MTSRDRAHKRLWKAYVRATDASNATAAWVLAERLYALNVGNGFFSYLLGKRLSDIGRNKEAKRRLLFAHKHSDGKRIEWVEIALGRACQALGEDDQAERWFRAAITSKPDDTAPAIYYASFLAHHARFAKACKVLEAAIVRRATGDVDEVYLNLACNKRALGLFDAASACLRRALKICPNYPAATKLLTDIRAAMSARKLRVG